MNNQPTNQNNSTEHVELSEELSPIVTPIELYEFFMAHDSLGRDAKDVWEHLVYTARKQHTNQVWAKNVYIQNGLSMGEKKVKAAKKFLADHNLIRYIKETDEQGRVVNWYIRVHGVKQLKKIPENLEESTGAVSTRVEIHPCGKDEQMLKYKNEMLKNKKQASTEDARLPVDNFKQDIEDALDTLETYGFNEQFRASTRERVQAAYDAGVRDFDKYYRFLHDRKPDAGPPLIARMMTDQDKLDTFLINQRLHDKYKPDSEPGGSEGKRADRPPMYDGRYSFDRCPICHEIINNTVNGMCLHCKALPEEQDDPLAYVADMQESLKERLPEVYEHWLPQLTATGLLHKVAV